MTIATGTPTSSARTADPMLADLVEQFLERIKAGKALDPAGFATAHAEPGSNIASTQPRPSPG